MRSAGTGTLDVLLAASGRDRGEFALDANHRRTTSEASPYGTTEHDAMADKSGASGEHQTRPALDGSDGFNRDLSASTHDGAE